MTGTLDLTPEQAEAIGPAIRGGLTLAQCEAQGQHQLLIRAEVYHEHRPSPAELRAEAQRLRGWTRDGSGYCRHGAYVGGCGIDWMCGPCEDQDQWAEAEELEAIAAQLETEEVRA